MQHPHDLVRRPIISEKSMKQMAENKYSFEVAASATKPEIRKAVEEVFKVKVIDVNTARVLGKEKRVGVHRGYTANWKKAVVTLAEGQRIEFFEGM
ncbi:MAG: 50S ribosomal protein L23 [bacterium]|jgi:large subunit ribosomal protein L23